MTPRAVTRAFLATAVVMVAAAVGVGLWLAGSPSGERQRRFDEQRVNELSQIASAVDNSYQRNGRLPGTLEALAELGAYDFYVPSLADPEDGTPYEYRTTGTTTYELCATFAAESQAMDARGVPKPPVARPAMMEYPGYRSWDHPAGRHCFSLDAEAVMAAPATLCSITNPCQAGQTCAQLPNRKGTYCVPQGKECLAAGCPDDRCMLLESYPVQVRCAEEPPSAPAPEPDAPVSNE